MVASIHGGPMPRFPAFFSLPSGQRCHGRQGIRTETQHFLRQSSAGCGAPACSSQAQLPLPKAVSRQTLLACCPCTRARPEDWRQRCCTSVLAEIAGEERINPCSAKYRSLLSPGQKHSQDSAQFGPLILIYWHPLRYCVNILFMISVSHFGKCCYKSG